MAGSSSMLSGFGNGLRLGLALGLLALPLVGQHKKPEPDAGALMQQGLENIGEFQTQRIVEAKKQELAKFIPAGSTTKVWLTYRVFKVVPGEDAEVKIFDRVLPIRTDFLTEGTAEYRQEETIIRGTGAYTKRGAPALQPLSVNDQVDWFTWNQWLERAESWEKGHRAEATMWPSSDEKPVQLDPAWIEQNRKLLGLSAEELRSHPEEITLGGMDVVLRALAAEAAGPRWSPSPGGILLSPTAAGRLGDGLTIDKVEYVPGSAEVKVSGRTSVMGLDADLLATTLRLAIGYDQIPYFSLDPQLPVGSDTAKKRLNEEINLRLAEDPAFAKAFANSAFEVVNASGRRLRIAYLEAVDPKLAALVAKRYPTDLDLVFQPKWLRRTRLGEILFIADYSIKELVQGAAAWGRGPSRALAVASAVRPKIWRDSGQTKRTWVQYWFAPGGQVVEGGHTLDLSQVQPVLQTLRFEGDSAFLNRKSDDRSPDPWAKTVVDEVNRHFDDYAKRFPEWEALRQVFRAYVFAIWLLQHDPATAHRLLTQLPAASPPSRPLPASWPRTQLLIAQMGEAPSSAEIRSVGTVFGGVGFEQRLVKAASGSVADGSTGIVASLPSGAGFSPNPIADDMAATPEGYAAWRQSLLRERGYLWAWVTAWLAPAELAFFAGIALVLALRSVWRARRMKLGFNRFEAGAIAIDLLATTLVFTLLALNPVPGIDPTAAFVGWWATIFSVPFFVFAEFLADKQDGLLGRWLRFVGILFAMGIAFFHAAFRPGLGEIIRGLTPLHLAQPKLGPIGGGPLPADIIYTLQGRLDEGLRLCVSAEPGYAFYPFLLLLVCTGLWFERRFRLLAKAQGSGGGTKDLT